MRARHRLSRPARMNEMNLEREALAVDGVFARRMEVKWASA